MCKLHLALHHDVQLAVELVVQLAALPPVAFVSSVRSTLATSILCLVLAYNSVHFLRPPHSRMNKIDAKDLPSCSLLIFRSASTCLLNIGALPVQGSRYRFFFVCDGLSSSCAFQLHVISSSREVDHHKDEGGFTITY